MNVVNRQAVVMLLMLAAGSWVGCSNPADKVPAASVSDAKKPTDGETLSAAAGAVEGDTYAFGPDTSKVDFIGSKVTGSHEGGFKSFAGEITVADGKVAGSGIKVRIETPSLYSDNEKLTGHLKNADFFDVEKFPTSEFQSTNVTQEDGGNATVTGNLTLHGVTKSISFPATIQVAKDSVTLTSEFSLNRSDFGIAYKGQTNDLIREQVVIKLDVNAVPGKADFAATP